MSVVYADELFVLNMGIDYFLLLGTAKVCALPLTRRRYALAAALGALWCCLSLLEGLCWLRGSAMKTVLALGMCLIAFGGSAALWRSFAVFLGLSVMFGGAVWAAGLARGLGYDGTGLLRLDMRVLLLSFALCWAGIELVFRRSVKKAQRGFCRIDIRRGRAAVQLRALRDTGNQLHDPATGKAVLIAETTSLAPLFTPDEIRALALPVTEALPRLSGFRLLPFSALGGSGLLPCFSPDYIAVDGEGRSDLAVALYDKTISSDGGYRALL